MSNMNKSELMNSFLKWIDQFPDDVVFARVDIEWAFYPTPLEKRGGEIT